MTHDFMHSLFFQLRTKAAMLIAFPCGSSGADGGFSANILPALKHGDWRIVFVLDVIRPAIVQLAYG
jgi:hypothetical protein